MILGSYPCCDGSLMMAISGPARQGTSLPAYLAENCPHCGAKVWHRLSRFDPMSWTEADFLAEHDIDLDKKIITAKLGTDAAKFDEVNRKGK